MPDQPPPKTAPPDPAEGRVTIQANSINVGGDFVGRDKTTNNITNIIHKLFVGGATEERDRRNRRIMLDKVRTFWVKGVLEQSLHGAALIELGMEYKPDAVQYPWNTVLQRPDHSPQPLTHGAKMIEVFDEEGGELLILGAPGSGKTTMLLDLARDLIARAEQDETLPIPVVFNLSSWAEKHPPLADWLIEELSFRYDVPKKVGKAWIEKDQVLPLLDGLDEVKLEQRAECVAAINNFRKDHLVHLAVCSRRAEYEALRAQLRLQSAIVLQPLTREQIDFYLQSAGEQLASVRASRSVQRDIALQELAESPLMLSIMVLAYRDLNVNSLPALDSAEKQRQRLFDTYVRRMFERRGVNKRYTPQQVTHWLSWLARRMVEHEQTTFYLERMQPDWLPSHLREAYATATGQVVGLVYGLVVGLIYGLYVGLLIGTWNGGPFYRLVIGLAYVPVVGLIVGLVNSLVFGLVFGLNNKIEAVKTLHSAEAGAVTAGQVVILVYGLIVGLVLVLVADSWGGIFYVLVNGLLVGLTIGSVNSLVFVLVLGLNNKIEAVKTLRWLWQDAKGGLLFDGLLSGLITGLFCVLVFGISRQAGLIVGLVNSLVFVLVFRLKKKIEAVKTLRWLWQDAKVERLLGGLFGQVTIALVNKTVIGLFEGGSLGVFYGLLSGLISGLIVGLDSKKIEAVEMLRWSWRWSWQDSKSGLAVGLVVGLVQVYILTSPFFDSPLFALAVWVITVLVSGVVGGLVGGLKAGREIETKTIPNQGMWGSARNAIWSGLIIGLLGGPVIGLFGQLFYSRRFSGFGSLFGWLFPGLFGGLSVGLFIGLIYGGRAFIQHFTLRLTLYLNGSIPLNYVRFLDYCAERIFLRKVGGGYIFVHRLLMEHFAELAAGG